MNRPICYLHLRPMKRHREKIPSFVRSVLDAVTHRWIWVCPVPKCYVKHAGAVPFRFASESQIDRKNYMQNIMGEER